MAEKQDKDESPQRGRKTKAGQAEEDSGSPVPGGVQVSPSADRPRRVQDVEGKPVDEPLD